MKGHSKRTSGLPRGTARRALTALGLLCAAALPACASASDGADGDGSAQEVNEGAGLEKINHFVVIYLENHSFNGLYGQFPGAVGLKDAPKESTIQVDL